MVSARETVRSWQSLAMGLAVMLSATLVAFCAKPRILERSHEGWKRNDCSECHSLPVSGHEQIRPPECAECHGANGACNPMAASVVEQEHQSSDTCTSQECHGAKHDYDAPTDCRSCHFAEHGLVDCGQ